MSYRQQAAMRYPHHQGIYHEVKGDGLLDVVKSIGMTVVKKSVETIADKTGKKMGEIIYEHFAGEKKQNLDPDKRFNETMERLEQMAIRPK